MQISFVIVTYNSDATIVKCIESINAHFITTYDQKDKLISAIVIDNNSTDKTVSLLNKLVTQYSWLQVKLLDKNIGFGPANNIGFETIDSDYYVLINADAWLVADSISPIIPIMNNSNKIAICGIPLVFPDGSPQTYTYAFSSWHRWLFHIFKIQNLVKKLINIKIFSHLFQLLPYSRAYVKNQQRSPIDLSEINIHSYKNTWNDVDWACGAGMIISNRFIEETKGFDPNIFLYGEDEDICIQAHQAGYRVITADVTPIVHMLGWGSGDFNQVVANLKFTSLNYFIEKNIKSKISKQLMKILLPVYVYGFKYFMNNTFSSNPKSYKGSSNEKNK